MGMETMLKLNARDSKHLRSYFRRCGEPVCKTVRVGNERDWRARWRALLA